MLDNINDFKRFRNYDVIEIEQGVLLIKKRGAPLDQGIMIEHAEGTSKEMVNGDEVSYCSVMQVVVHEGGKFISRNPHKKDRTWVAYPK